MGTTSLPRALVVTAGWRLAAYGTLRPGGCNHRELSACVGTWTEGFVRGWLEAREFPALIPDVAAPLVAVAVLASARLPEHWRRLDAFEGDDYVRVLAPVVDDRDRLLTVANLYALARGRHCTVEDG